jgi:transposase
MRGQDSRSGSLFSYVDLEQRVRSDHPLRTIRTLVNEALASLDGCFGEIYSEIGRPSIPPEQLLRAMLLQAFYSVRSERQLMERLDFDLLFRWFVGLGIDDAVWDASTFSKNRDRLLAGSVAAAFLSAVLAIPRVKRLLSQDHFSVDGTLIQAWASMKSFRPKDDTPPNSPVPPAGGRNAEVDFHGQRLSNDTHQSTTDPEVRLYRKGQGREAKLCFMGHALMENRNGLIVDGCVTEANGHAERTAALVLIEKRAERPGRITLGADKGYDAADFVNELRSMNVTPHIAQNTAGRRSAIDGRTTRHPGYAVSQRSRQAHRGRLRLGQGDRAVATHPGAGPRARRHGVRLLGCRLQPHPPAKAAVRSHGGLKVTSQGPLRHRPLGQAGDFGAPSKTRLRRPRPSALRKPSKPPITPNAIPFSAAC